ncbi:MAG: hypothetical protein ACD_46C00314G0002 [uncultured bacterium]|nr:MAG: hypothetical protein ACD_46C00314G0002 [uncultured bacterium]
MYFKYVNIVPGMNKHEKNSALYERRKWVNNSTELSVHRKTILLALLDYADKAFQQNVVERTLFRTKNDRYDIFNNIFKIAGEINHYEKDKEFFDSIEQILMQIEDEYGDLRSKISTAVVHERHKHVIALRKDSNSSVAQANQGYQNLLVATYLVGLSLNGLDSTGFVLLTSVFAGTYYYFFNEQANHPSRATQTLYQNEDLRQKGQQINQVLFSMQLFPRALTLFGRAANTALSLGNAALTQIEAKARQLEIQYANQHTSSSTPTMTELPASPPSHRK